MCFERNGVGIGAGHDRKPGILEPEAQAPGPAEQVNRPGSRTSVEPLPVFARCPN